MLLKIDPEHRFFPLVNLLAGALTFLAFAPFDQVWLIFISFSVLFYSLLHSSPRRALLSGWLFGLGIKCTGVSWIFFSLHYHGGTPVPLAVFMVFLLSCYLAIYPALACYLVSRFCKAKPAVSLMLLYPLSWAVFEWLQGWVMTGFVWMQPGYTQIETALAGFAPVFGNLGVGIFIAVTSGTVVALLSKQLSWQKACATVAVIWLTGFVLKQISWTQPVDDEVQVSLVQGNVQQVIKWRRDMYQPTLNRYRELSLAQTNADLIIWPETAVPGYVYRASRYLSQLSKEMKKTNTDVLTGIFIRDKEAGRYYNSVINIHGGEYRKRHLVPLGEFIPMRFAAEFFNRWIKVPMSDIDSGDDVQPLIMGAGQPLGISICFEDAFSRDVRKDLPEATLLVNVSNDAWFDGSHEPYQHHAIARMRALEAGRFMLRATNTGISSIIAPDGSEVVVAPQFETHVLSAKVQPMKGATPYVFWGDYFVIMFSMFVIGFFVYRGRV